MIGLNKDNTVWVQTGALVDSYDYRLRSMVRLISLSLNTPQFTDDDKYMIQNCCDLLESMLPEEGQLDLVPQPPKGAIRAQTPNAP